MNQFLSKIQSLVTNIRERKSTIPSLYGKRVWGWVCSCGVLFLTSCIGGDEEFKECVQPFQVVYRTQLITNEDVELVTMLHDTPQEEELARRLKAELADMFTFENTVDRVVETKMPDLQLCFYKSDAEQPEVTYHLIDNVGAAEQTFPTELDVMLPYWHAALCGVEANKRYNGPVSGISHFGQEYATTLSLYQPEASIAYSHRHGIYTGRVQIPAHGQDGIYYCDLYQANSAVAAVIDPGEVEFDAINAYIARTADRFDVQDSLFYCTNTNLQILCNRLEETGCSLICLWGACLPCVSGLARAEIDKEGEGSFDFIIEMRQEDAANNRTLVSRATCHVKDPLLAAELKILKFRLRKGQDGPEVECVNADVAISVDLQWHQGLGFDTIPL